MTSTNRLLLHSEWSLRTVLSLISSEQLTCAELARFCLATAVAGENIWQLHAFSRLSSWETIQQAAQASDQRRKDGRPKSPLDGIPISIKANLAWGEHALTAGSWILGEDTPSSSNGVGYNAAIVQNLISHCGAICIGITNMDEFGMGSLGTAAVPPTQNPTSFLSQGEDEREERAILDILQQSPSKIASVHEQYLSDNQHSYSAGGSSCGAAASVAHGSSLVALGSDTGGSIRLPGAWCGVVGMKPSYGRISRHGLVSYASSLDTVGFLTRTVDCAYLVMNELRQEEQLPQDSTSHQYSLGAQQPSSSFTVDNIAESPLKGLKVGIPSAFVVEECPQSVQEAWLQGASELQQAGATIVPIQSDIVSPAIIQQSLAAYYVLACAEASSNLARFDGFRYGATTTDENEVKALLAKEGTALQQRYSATRTQGFGQEVIRRVLCGTAVLSSDKFHTHYEAASKLRALVTQQLRDALTTQVDFLLIPTVVSPPPCLPTTKGEDEEGSIDNTAMFANDIMTVPINLAGLPAVNVPFDRPSQVGTEPDSGMKSFIGLQLVGHRLQEEELLGVAQWLEKQ